MIRDDIVALLPDLRAFSRFLCREREAADDLVQNTILSALDKQDQLVGRIQERYGIAKDEAQKQVDGWINRM